MSVDILGTNCDQCRSMVQYCFTSTETVRLIRDGEKGGKGVWKWGAREIIYLSLHCVHQNDFCINVGSDESHLMFHNCEGQSHKTMSTDHNF